MLSTNELRGAEIIRGISKSLNLQRGAGARCSEDMTVFCSGKPMDMLYHIKKDARKSARHLSDFLHKAHLFLSTYAKDESLEEAVTKMMSVKHLAAEDVQHNINYLNDSARGQTGPTCSKKKSLCFSVFLHQRSYYL